MYTYKIMQSENAKTYGNGNVSVRLEITNTDTNETKVCDDFTYLDDDGQETLAHIFNSNFELQCIFYLHLNKKYAITYIQ